MASLASVEGNEIGGRTSSGDRAKECGCSLEERLKEGGRKRRGGRSGEEYGGESERRTDVKGGQGSVKNGALTVVAYTVEEHVFDGVRDRGVGERRRACSAVWVDCIHFRCLSKSLPDSASASSAHK